MGKLIYTAICSLDGYVADEQGSFDWAEPQEEVHSFINGLEARNEVVLYGRKLYEVMLAWESLELESLPLYIQDYARTWRRTEKIVYSRTLKQVQSTKTTLRSNFDPQELSTLIDSTKGDLGIGGPELAGQAMAHALVDEVNLFVYPEIIGGGTRALAQRIRARLSLVETKQFDRGVVLLHYTSQFTGRVPPF